MLEHVEKKRTLCTTVSNKQKQNYRHYTNRSLRSWNLYVGEAPSQLTHTNILDRPVDVGMDKKIRGGPLCANVHVGR
jgi:hypothetical protein